MINQHATYQIDIAQVPLWMYMYVATGISFGWNVFGDNKCIKQKIVIKLGIIGSFPFRMQNITLSHEI